MSPFSALWAGRVCAGSAPPSLRQKLKGGGCGLKKTQHGGVRSSDLLLLPVERLRWFWSGCLPLGIPGSSTCEQTPRPSHLAWDCLDWGVREKDVWTPSLRRKHIIRLLQKQTSLPSFAQDSGQDLTVYLIVLFFWLTPEVKSLCTHLTLNIKTCEIFAAQFIIVFIHFGSASVLRLQTHD